MTKIISLAGKKSSGKNTSANWLLGITMIELAIRDGVRVGVRILPITSVR